jgi:hypothetical protein
MRSTENKIADGSLAVNISQEEDADQAKNRPQDNTMTEVLPLTYEKEENEAKPLNDDDNTVPAELESGEIPQETTVTPVVERQEIIAPDVDADEKEGKISVPFQEKEENKE